MEEKSNHFYEILKGFPQSDEKIVTFGDQPSHSEGIVIRFFKSDKTTWIGNFNPGHTELTQIERLKNKNEALVIVCGNGYIIDIEKATTFKVFHHIDILLCIPDGRLIVTDGSVISVIESSVSVWNSEMIGYGGISDLKLSGDLLTGEAYSPTQINDKMIPFSLNLLTHVVKLDDFPILM